MQAFELAGAACDRVHINRLVENPGLLSSYGILAIAGGFSYGDDISAGRILAQQISSALLEPLRRFVESGRPIAGICNGFQVLVKTELLPGHAAGEASAHPATLAHNTSGRFTCKWVDVEEDPTSRCVWTKGVGQFSLPMAHGEGRFVPATGEVLSRLKANGQVALRYVAGPMAQGSGTAGNPNGAVDDIAGVCDETGLVFGLMPHPERHLRASQHPAWTSLGLEADAEGPGARIFRNAVGLVR